MPPHRWLDIDLAACRLHHSDWELTDIDWERSHALWRHAERVIAANDSELARADAIIALKRSLQLRINHLETEYCFSAAPGVREGSRALERLQLFGLVRPTMLKRLIDVRNLIEHEDAPPPSLDETNVLLDTLWYFLRSTDLLVMRRPTGMTFYPQEHEDHWLEITVDIPGWIFNAHGWLPANSVRPSPPGTLELDPTEIHTMAQAGPADSLGGRGQDPDDLYIRGRVLGPATGLQKLAELAFTLP